MIAFVLLAAEVLLLVYVLRLLKVPFLWILLCNINAIAVVQQHPLLDDSVRLEGKELLPMCISPVLPYVQPSFRCQFGYDIFRFCCFVVLVSFDLFNMY